MDEQTHDREVERDEFQHTLEVMTNQIEELKRENAKLYEVKKQNAYQIDEYSARLKSAEEDEMEMVQKQEKTEIDLKNAVEKVKSKQNFVQLVVNSYCNFIKIILITLCCRYLSYGK